MKNLFFLLSMLAFNGLYAQLVPSLGEVFKDDVIPRIDIILPQDSLAAIYDPANQNSNYHYHATFIFDNGTVIDTLQNIGFRLRGNTSRAAAKKSFKVSFNTYVQGQKYYGIEKMNLNGEHNDPSIVRSKLGWKLFREAGLAVPRANHVELYINGSYYGLYINVEHIDEEFVENRFDNKDGNLFKCLYPADLDYISNNPDDYKQVQFGRRFYDLRTNTTADDYSDLANFITILNNSTNFECELEQVFNVNNYLKIMALEILIAHWDGYIFNKNNFYLYHNTETDKFEYIPYDVDNTFGIDWSNIDWKTRNIYTWSSGTRPLYTKLMANPTYKERFSYYMNELLADYYGTSTFLLDIDTIKTQIQNAATNDNYRTLDYGYTITDFNNSFTQSIGGHVKDGIKPFITARTNSVLTQLNLTDISPIITDLSSQFNIPNQPIILKALIEDEAIDSVWAGYKINGGSETLLLLYDDGNHNDELAGDGIFANLYTPSTSSTSFEYRIKAQDSQQKISYSPTCNYKTLPIGSSTVTLVINEFMADNDVTILDDAGDYDDWIELYNPGTTPVDLQGIYITDNFSNPTKFQLPAITLNPDSYLLVWADEDGNQGDLHANFKLSKNGEEIGIFDNQGLLIDSVSFGVQQSDIATARLPNGTGNFQTANFSTPNGNNDFPLSTISILYDEKLMIKPNPFTDVINVEWENSLYKLANLTVYNQLGQVVWIENRISNKHQLIINQLSQGIYFLSVEIITTNNEILQFPIQKMIKVN